jgi:hypothetical protein
MRIERHAVRIERGLALTRCFSLPCARTQRTLTNPRASKHSLHQILPKYVITRRAASSPRVRVANLHIR